MPQVRSHGAWIDYLDEGLGDPALLLMPEWCGTRSAFTPVMRMLSSDRRVLAPDWRGHGASPPAPRDFGADDLLEDALTVIADSGAQSVVPVALAHAGWVAIELRRRLGHKLPGIVVVDWIVTAAPASFLSTLEDLRSDADRDDAVAGLVQQWQGGVPSPQLAGYLAEMGAAGDEMWERAARETESSYARHGSPLRAFSELESSVPVLHLVPSGSGTCSFAEQRAYMAEHHWYHAAELPARSHFPLFEAPGQATVEIEAFVRRVSGRSAFHRAA
ncbi:MAG TPA: alpha/beta hydrolase [Thermoleophilia bacterium]|nr:alpha/beta hydrolase [Thermoleophilia bacterium]